jgi:HAE1 family hydrophobic/amphiphilic exporter-1
MNLASISIKRPVFVSCIVVLMLVLGWMSLKKMPVDLFPDVAFPIVMVSTGYPGAGPVEVETLVSKPLEDEMSTLPGIKTLSSVNKEGISTVIAEFTLETDIKYAEQQVRDRVGSARRKLPDDITEPVIRRLDPADQPILIIALAADLPAAKLFDLADEVIRPKIEQVSQVGLVEVIGGREREIRVELDRKKLRAYEISATQVSQRIAAAGQNIPAGKVDEATMATVYRTLGEFKNVSDIEKTIVNFLGNDVSVTIADVGKVSDTLADEKTRGFVNGDKAVFLMVFRQSKANTIAVVDAVKKRLEVINDDFVKTGSKSKLTVVRDGSKMIRANVADVNESIFIGVLLTLLVVYFFLGSGRSTFITGLAIPNSLIGAFILIGLAGFSINVMSLLALSLAVGLLIDDAIVVRENIFRHREMGKSSIQAALEGTKEVTLAVIATTLAVLAVFGPIGFLKGVVGQFFKEFGLTVCFAMAISLFDALTMAPMLSAYVGGSPHRTTTNGLWGKTMGKLLIKFDHFQTWMEEKYASILKFSLKRPFIIFGVAMAIFLGSFVAVSYVPKTFISGQDAGEFSVNIELTPGTNIQALSEEAEKIDKIIRQNKEIATSVMFLGGREGESNVGQFFIQMIPSKERKLTTTQLKDKIREQLRPFAYANPIVKDIDAVGGGMRPFNVNLIGNNLDEIEDIGKKLFEKIKNHPALSDVENSIKKGKPEFQVNIDNQKAERLGVSTATAGQEIRTLIEGATPAVFRENGKEYDIRVRLSEDQRNLKEAFQSIYVPNINGRLIPLTQVANPIDTLGPTTINRQDRGRYVQISADVASSGPGMAAVINDINRILKEEIKLPPGVRYTYVGQAESFKELTDGMIMAVILGVLFIFVVLASLYESIVTPFTIMLVLPLASCGAFYALFLTGKSLDLFSMIGCVMLLGVATKNSILLVDYTNQLIAEGMERSAAIIQAGKVRLRPILMTTVALIAGMLPIAIGLNEASRQRTGMGVAVIGGLITSTLLTLVVVPAAYGYFDRFRIWSGGLVKKWIMTDS